jgi:hypothetical protein
MADDAKRKEGSSTMVIALSALLALGAAGGVYYFYDEAEKSEKNLIRAKDEYKKMAERKKPVEEYLRQSKGRKATMVDSNEDMLVFLDKKERETQMPLIPFAKGPPNQLSSWTEIPFTATFQGTKDAGIKKIPVVDFLRKVEAERRSTKVKALQLQFSGDEFKSATITLSQFAPKQ